MQYVNRQYPPTPDEKRKREAEDARREAELKLKNNRLGVTIFQISWIMVFVCMLVIYWWMGYQPNWRPTPAQAPSAILPTIATIALVVSGWFARRGLKTIEAVDRAAPADAKRAFLRPWRIAIGLGTLFLLIMTGAYIAVPANNATAQFGYIYRLMIGYHALHALVIGYMMIRIDQLSDDGRYHAENSWPVEGATKLWYFVVVAWLMFYPVLYLPYLM
jgi:heme/copper-type cytochrome/quinol oxidase subunit 3